jgi:membrane-associated protease RseP (regulator of RpoE activity)
MGRKGEIISATSQLSEADEFSEDSTFTPSPVHPFTPTPLLPYSPTVVRRAMRPTAKAWLRHSFLLFLTFLTTTFGGIVFLHQDKINVQEPSSAIEFIKTLPFFYFKFIGAAVSTAFAHPAILTDGLIFSLSLLAILTAHEAGHYVACRIYGVDATLPFFIPSPPLVGPGTFGAFIKIVSPIWSRRALFDIGVAGPIAGFIIVIPVTIMALLTAHPVPANAEIGMVFNDPLLVRFFASLLNLDLNTTSAANPFYFAAWIGLLVTSLNLIPVGQLDGAHAVYAVFGSDVHKSVGKIAFVTMATLALLGWFWYSSPSGFLYVILLAVMLRVRHPEPEEMTPLDTKRLVIAFITLLVFMLCFVPFPIEFR